MVQHKWVRFQGEVGNVAARFTEKELQDRQASAAAAQIIREHLQYEGAEAVSQQKQFLINEGYKAKRRHHEKRILLKSPESIPLGNVLKGQTPLMRREMFRRRLFPIRFEESARNVEEVQQLLMQRQPVGQLVVSLLYLAMLLLFLSYALEVTKIFEATDGITAPLRSALAPTPSNFNSISYEVARAEQAGLNLESVEANPESGHPENISMLTSKTGVASWLLYGFIPLLYGPSPETSNLGTAKVLGKCFRLTFRQVELQDVDGFDLGYEGVWPLTTVHAAASVASEKLRSDNPLTNPPGSTFTYTYPFAASGEDAAFNWKGGHYQVICEESLQASQTALRQGQQHSRYPPWFVPVPVIADRRTLSTVVDFFTVNPITETFSHCAVLFSFTSSGTLQKPVIWVSSLIGFSSQSNGLVRYTALGLLLIFMALYLLCEYLEVKRLGFKAWLKEGWSIFLLFHLLTLLGLLASFAAVQVIALLAPEVESKAAASGYYDVTGAPTATDEASFFQLVSDYGGLFKANDQAQQACIVFGSLAGLTGCVLTARLIPVIAGVQTKSVQMTFRKVKNHLLACILGMLAILLIFVCFGNISLGAATSSFAGYYESLTTSAAFLLGGTLRNYDVYSLTSISPVLAGMFFVPLFLIFSVFGFTILTAVVLRKYDFCAQSVEQNVIKHKLEGQEVRTWIATARDTIVGTPGMLRIVSPGRATMAGVQALFRTRYEWLRYTVLNLWRGFWKAMRSCWTRETLALIAADEFEDDHKEVRQLKSLENKKGLRKRKKKRGEDYYRRDKQDEAPSSAEEYYDAPPQYPPWVWETMGMEDPINIYAAPCGEQQQTFYVDPASMAAYSRTYGYFSGFDITGVAGPSDCYFTPDIAATTVPKAPAPSVSKVYLLVRNQMKEDHEDAWKKLFVAAFVAIVVATVNLQLSVDKTADIREMASKAVLKTAFPLAPIRLTCADPSLGAPNVDASITFPNQPLFGATTSRDLYSWLVAEQGLMTFVAPPTDSTLFGDAFPKLTMPDGSPYQQLVVSNWNSTMSTRSVRVILVLREETSFPTQLGFSCEGLQCQYQPLFEPSGFREFLKKLDEQQVMRDVVSELTFQLVLLNSNHGNMLLAVNIKFPRNRGGTISTSTFIEAFNLQPYATWNSTTIAAVALQVATAVLFLFFGCSFFVELHRLWRSLKKEREDFTWGLCLGVFFVDDLFNILDLIGFVVLACSIMLWVLHVFNFPQSQLFNLTEDLAEAAAASAAGGTQEADAAAAAGALFEEFRSAAALLRSYSQLAAAILAVAFLRLLRIGRKRKRMTLMFFTLASAAGEMIQILIGTTLVFIGFSYLCFLSFGRQVEGHSTVKDSFISTLSLTIGCFPLSQLFHADSIMAGAFIFPYLFFMGIVCFSFFLCVLLRSLAYRTTEIKTMERLGKVETPSLLKSLQLFLRELSCNFQPTREVLEKKEKELELQHLQQQENDATAFGKRTESDQENDFNALEMIEQAERKRRERPVRVVEMPSNVVTSALSDEQYAGLPEEVRLFASQEVASFVDRFRLMATRFQLGSGDIVSLVQQLENDAYAELSTLYRDVAQQEGHLQHELSVYTSQVFSGQDRLTAYIKFLEQALQDRQEELQLQNQELILLEAKFEEEKHAAERYGSKR